MNLEDEKVREKVLKRFLPSLVILVIYFTYIRGAINEDLKKAEKQYQDIANLGISADVIPALQKTQTEVAVSVSKVQKEYREIRQDLDKHTFLLNGSENVNQILENISAYLTKNNLHVISEKWADSTHSAALPKSFNAVRQWLEASKTKDSAANEKTAQTSESIENVSGRLRVILFYGSYLDTFKAMVGFAAKKFKAIPVSLDMKLPDEEGAEQRGQLQWQLKLWI